MVKTQISHPTSSPLISGFDWHTPLFFFFSLLPVCFSCCWLCLSVCVITGSQQPWACLPQPHWIHSPYSPPLSLPPPLSLSLSVTGWRATTPYFHKCSKSTKTSCSATYHEGRVVPWSCWKPAERLGDWERDPRVVLFFFSFFFLRKCLFFPCFALASVEEDFLQRPTFCCCFLDMMGKKKTFIDSLCSKHAYWHRI